MINLLDLQWWQGAVAILGLLGLSPAPWLLGLAMNRIQFTAPARADYAARLKEITDAHDREVANLKDAHAAAIRELTTHHTTLSEVQAARFQELERSRDYYRQARLTEQERANRATDQLVEFAELAKLNVHVLQSLDQAAKDAT